MSNKRFPDFKEINKNMNRNKLAKIEIMELQRTDKNRIR